MAPGLDCYRTLGIVLAVLLLPAGATHAAPEPFLELDTLDVTAGQPFELKLTLPTGESWAEANIGRLALRTYGTQESIDVPSAAGNPSLNLTIHKPGPAMLILSAGANGDRRHSDSWQRTPYCAKFFFRVAPAPKAPAEERTPSPDPGTCAKVGQKIELLPAMPPTELHAGDHLAVRAYFEGGAQTGDPVTAYRPNGTSENKLTKSKGFVDFLIDQPGRWLIRYSKFVDGRKYIADLVFDVPKKPRDKNAGRKHTRGGGEG